MGRRGFFAGNLDDSVAGDGRFSRLESESKYFNSTSKSQSKHQHTLPPVPPVHLPLQTLSVPAKAEDTCYESDADKRKRGAKTQYQTVRPRSKFKYVNWIKENRGAYSPKGKNRSAGSSPDHACHTRGPTLVAERVDVVTPKEIRLVSNSGDY